MAETLGDVLRKFKGHPHDIYVREQIAGKLETVALGKLPGFLAIDHMCRMLLDRFEAAGVTWMLEQSLDVPNQGPVSCHKPEQATLTELSEEIMRLRRTLRILYIQPLDADSWGVRSVQDHNSIIREALCLTEDEILKRQESDIAELSKESDTEPLHKTLERWIATMADRRNEPL